MDIVNFVKRLARLAVELGCLAVGMPAHAAGVTTHWYMGDVALAQIAAERPDLAAVLTLYNDMYLRGIVFPDASQHFFVREYGIKKNGKKKWDSADEASHGKLNGTSVVTEMLTQMIGDCADKFKSRKPDEKCGSALAFALGMVAHMVSDSPWHVTWIRNQLTKNCPDLKNDAQKAHTFADHDTDICLAARLHGNTGWGLALNWIGAGIVPVGEQIPFDLTVSLKQAKAILSKTPIQLLCPAGQFFDPTDGGTCWSCPSGYRRNVNSVKSPDACFKPATNDFDPAKRHGKATGIVGTDCPRGQFVHLGLFGSHGYCYSCPKDSGRTLERIDQNRACMKTVHHAPMRASPGGKAGFICPAGQFVAPKDTAMNLACFSCPASAPTHYLQYKVDDDRVCQKVATVQCSKLGVYADSRRESVKTAIAVNNIAQERVKHVWTYLSPAYMKSFPGIAELNNKTKMDKNAAEINSETDEYARKSAKEHMIQYSDLYLDDAMRDKKAGLSEDAGNCAWGYAHANDAQLKGSGNIPESATEAKKFMVGIWDALTRGTIPEFTRTDSCQYSLKAFNNLINLTVTGGGNCSF